MGLHNRLFGNPGGPGGYLAQKLEVHQDQTSKDLIYSLRKIDGVLHWNDASGKEHSCDVGDEKQTIFKSGDRLPVDLEGLVCLITNTGEVIQLGAGSIIPADVQSSVVYDHKNDCAEIINKKPIISQASEPTELQIKAGICIWNNTNDGCLYTLDNNGCFVSADQASV